MRPLLQMSLILALTAAASACGGPTGPALPTRPVPTRIPTATPLPPLPTVPAPGSAENPITIMLVTTEPSEVEDDAQALAETLSEESGLLVQITPVTRYADALHALCDGRAHVVSLSAFAYIAASAQECGDPLYVAELEGETATQGQLLTGVGRSVFSTAGFRGYRFCRPAPYSLSGWIVPGLALEAAGVSPLRDLFSITDSGSDEDVVRMIISFRCDVGATRVGAERDIPGSQNVVIIDTLPTVPNDAIILSLMLDIDTRDTVRDMLSDHRDDLADLLGVDSLDDVNDEAYEDLRALFEAAGIDPIIMGE